MAFARQILVVLTAVALAVAPVDAALAAHAPTHGTGGHADHAMPHSDGGAAAQIHDCHGTRHAAKQAQSKASDHRKGGAGCCCGDKGACVNTCLMKCFAQVAVMPTERAAQKVQAYCFAPHPVERAPGWSFAPRPPPPRV